MIIAMKTERLLVRNFKLNDWTALLEMIVQYESSEYAKYDWQWPTSPEEIKGVTECFACRDSYLAVCLKDTGRFIGFVSLNQEQGEGRQEFNIGYIFNSDYHGQGYATEACQAVLRYAFDRLQAQRVITGTAAANRASCRLLERLGFQLTASGTSSLRNTPDGTPIEFLGCTYSISRDEWGAAGQRQASMDRP